MRHGTFGLPIVPDGLGTVVPPPLVPEPEPEPEPEPDPEPEPEPDPVPEPCAEPEADPDPAPEPDPELVPALLEPADPLTPTVDDGCAPGLSLAFAVTAPAVRPDVAALTGVCCTGRTIAAATAAAAARLPATAATRVVVHIGSPPGAPLPLPWGGHLFHRQESRASRSPTAFIEAGWKPAVRAVGRVAALLRYWRSGAGSAESEATERWRPSRRAGNAGPAAASGAGAGGTTLVQYLHRLAATGIMLRHSGHSRSLAAWLRAASVVSFWEGATSKKYTMPAISRNEVS